MKNFSLKDFDFLDKKTKKILMESRNSFVPHTPYQCEKNMLATVRAGNLELARQAMKKLEESGQSGILSKDPLRQSQIIFISFITQITRAAMDAGVSEDFAYAMSDSYIQTSENCSKPQQISLLEKRALMDFVNAVRHQKASPPFSRATRAAINYMHSHMQEKILLKDLARASGLSQGRFSHLFKKETGQSPMSYLLREKIETAQTMLLYSDAPVSQISSSLCFSSESHFIKTFQNFLGVSPGKYRRLYS